MFLVGLKPLLSRITCSRLYHRSLEFVESSNYVKNLLCEYEIIQRQDGKLPAKHLLLSLLRLPTISASSPFNPHKDDDSISREEDELKRLIKETQPPNLVALVDFLNPFVFCLRPGNAVVYMRRTNQTCQARTDLWMNLISTTFQSNSKSYSERQNFWTLLSMNIPRI